MFPFAEHIYNSLFYNDNNSSVRSFEGLKTYEIGSIVHSLAKTRYNNDAVLLALGSKLLYDLKTDHNMLQPHYT